MTGRGEMKIRPGRTSDLGPVQDLERICFEDPWSLEALYGELMPDHLRMPLVALIDDQLCGYLMAWRVADQLHILNIATDPKIQRQGVGTALLLAAARFAAGTGQVEVTLEVRRSNEAARAFYLRHHFVETGVRPGYYQDNGEDAIIMTALCGDILAGCDQAPSDEKGCPEAP